MGIKILTTGGRREVRSYGSSATVLCLSYGDCDICSFQAVPSGKKAQWLSTR